MRTNICFHGIGASVQEREPGEARYWVSESFFLGVLDDVAGRSDIDISFDDGNVSDVATALPALVERGMTATFFALAGRLERSDSLGPSELATLNHAGMSIGTHGWAHVPWRRLSESDAQREFIDARDALEEASGAKITAAAFPLGQYDRRTLSALKRARYDAVFTSDRFPLREGSWLRARYSVTSSDTLESARELVRRRPGLQEARNVVASAVKRIR